MSPLIVALLLAQPGSNSCLMYVSENLARGNGNWYAYYEISNQAVKIEPGDVLQYDVFLDPKNPSPKGGVDVDFGDDGDSLRDLDLVDQNGIRAHGDGLLLPAVGKWYEREIPLDKAAGRTSTSWNLVFEGDEPGRYVQFIDHIGIKRRDGTDVVVYGGGPPPMSVLVNNAGYTRNPVCQAVSREAIHEGADLEPLVTAAVASAQKMSALNDAMRDARVVEPFVKSDVAIEAHVQKAIEIVRAAEDKPNISDAEVKTAVAQARSELTYAKPELQKNVAHLVGYAHIDFQWLWNWQEATVASHDTFRQALKFMDEFPGFKFSQSSSGLYQGVQENYPDLFAKIKTQVAAGRLEILGGRVCEADTNVIGPESHARQFLYAQRYFRENLGKTATVGWEPDTFGHTIQMPQILKLGGCDSYFFCRAGKDEPLFWWKGLDGSKVIAFDDTAAGSWYNSELTDGQFGQMSRFEEKTGLKDMLYVYGVGNHGGGPTREEIEEAERWKKVPYLPKTEYSTARQFFDAVLKSDLSKVPVIDQELNTVFDGCYTTHCEIKKAMRQAETWTSTAEAVSAVALLDGIPYPRAELRKDWTEICMNQHHDTMGGSGMHQPYEKTRTELAQVYGDDQQIIVHAMECLSQRVKPEAGGISVIVFNPNGWARSGWCNTYLAQSGWAPDNSLDPARAVAVAPDGVHSTVDVLDATTAYARFWAGDVPAFGYKVFHIVNGVRSHQAVQVRDNRYTLENANLIVEFDKATGQISKLTYKKTGHVVAGSGLGRLEAHYEEPTGMSAWNIGRIAKVDALVPITTGSQQGDDYAEVWFNYRFPSVNNPAHPTTARQVFRLESGSDQVECTVSCDWNQIGSPKTNNPTLRMAFDTGIANPTATYEVPFGALSRPLDGKEYPGQKWADLSGDGFGVSVLNDCMYGHSALGSTLWVTLIRSSFNPDPLPNPGHHVWHYAIYPHAGTWQEAGTVRRAAEFNQPMVDATVPMDAAGAAPLSWGLLQFSDPGVVATALKGAEDGDGIVLRAYESSGAGSSGSVRFSDAFGKSQWVNFVEDPLGAAPMSGSELAFAMHKFEIKTVKLGIK